MRFIIRLFFSSLKVLQDNPAITGGCFRPLAGTTSTLAKCAVGELLYNLITRTDVIFKASIALGTSKTEKTE